MEEFNIAADAFVSSGVVFIRKHRYYLGNNYQKYLTQLEAVLKSLHVLHCLKWKAKEDIVLRVEEAIVRSVSEWYNFVKTRIIKLDDDKANCGISGLTSSSASSSSGSEYVLVLT